MYGGWKEMVVGVLLVVLLWKWCRERNGCDYVLPPFCLLLFTKILDFLQVLIFVQRSDFYNIE